MKHCENMQELISAYIDNEISEPDRKMLEEHLSMCESCSALLDMYKKMSVALTASAVNAPGNLCKNVMEKVLSEKGTAKNTAPAEPDTTSQNNDEKQKKSTVIYLKRYLPAVACLVIILLALPFALTINNQTNYDEPIYAAPAAMAEAFAEIVPMDIPSIDDMEMPAAGGRGFDAPETAASAPVFDPWPTAGAMPAELELPDPPEQSPENATDPSYWDVEEAPEPPAEASPALTVEEQLALENYLASINPGDDTRTGISAYTETHYGLEYASIESIVVFDRIVRDSYVLIEITGQLPDSLSQHEPEAVGEWAVWEKVFRISRDEALRLIDELEEHEDIVITLGDANSGYAMVLFASSR